MKQRVKLILLAAGLAVLILLAVFGYQYLTEHYQPGEPDSGTTAERKTSPAADFSMYDMQGEAVTLSSHFGKPLIINFWATWCGPCKSELPAFDAMYQKYGGEITFLMVNLTDGDRETVQGVTKFIAAQGYRFPVYFDSDSRGSSAYGISSIPLTVMIDENGNLFRKHTGQLSETTLEKYIQDLIGGAK